MSSFTQDLNRRSLRRLDSLTHWIDLGHVGHRELESGAVIYDFGIEARGGVTLGCELARLLLADLAEVKLLPLQTGDASPMAVAVETDDPLAACMGAQYAGWPVQSGDFFAMGSGPMRSVRGREDLLKKYELNAEETTVFGGLETDQFPNDDVVETIADDCNLELSSVILAVAPVTSLAGTVQVVARSVETALHKLDDLGFDLRQVRSAYGHAPLPPPATKTIEGIGRTNDAILYGGQVCLWVDTEDDWIAEFGAKIPSQASPAHGEPFAEIFRRHDNDFYAIDPGLFSPARVTLINQRSGRQFTFGELRDDLLQVSFS